MLVLIDNLEFSKKTKHLVESKSLFVINHLTENTISVVLNEYDDDFNYLGFNSSPCSIPIGEKVVCVDDDGDKHEITRIK